MNACDLINFFRNNSIDLNVVDGKIKFKAPRGFMTDELLDGLKTNKDEIIALLKTSGENRQIIPRRPENAPIPLSFAQQRLWFLDQFEPGSAFYNIPIAVRLIGELNESALRRTLNEIVRRHEALRTSFAVLDGVPVQVIAEQIELTLPITDLTELPAAEREARAQQLARNEAQTPFDLSTGPLIRASLIRLDATDHLLLFTMHHIVSDGWSMGILVNEVVALYAVYVQKQQPASSKRSPLPELPIQYADFAHWQRQWLSGNVLQQELDYWTGQLSGSPTLLTLPTDHPRPVEPSHRGAVRSFEISAQTTAGLYALNKQTQTTLFMTLAAAFSILLSRYSGQSDICLGTSIANRNRAEIEALIGFFVNTLVLRTRIDSAATFESLLQQVRATTLSAYAHQDMPFEQLVDLLKPERHTSHSPLFQVMLVLQNMPMQNLELPGLKLKPAVTESATAKFDLTLNIAEKDGQLFAWLEYSTDLFDEATIERMTGHFTRLLDAIAATPGARIQDLPMLGADELHQLLVEWNAAETVYPQEQCIHELFESQVEKTPEAVAVVFEDQKLTYTELNARANQLAHYLRSQGVGPDALVGICVERSLEMIVGLLGILKAGGAYVPLDPTYPQERLAYMLQDAKPAVLLTQQSLQQPFPIAVFCLDSQWETLNSYARTNPENSTLPDNLAYVIYTSGSTGKPKGSLLTHANVARLFSATDAWFGFDEKDTWTLFHSYAFDFSVWEIWGALLYGGKLVIVPYLVSRSPDQFHALLAQEQVTILNQTPLAFQQLVEVDLRQANPPELALRKVIFGGEALNQAALAPWFDRHGYDQPNLINMYGITETTVHVTYHPLQAGEKHVSCIGRPIPDLGSYLLDANMNPVPVGVPGELCIAGDGLARGYLGRPDLTAEKFIPNPFSSIPGARMYKSGDLGRYLPASRGNIEYLGRIDSQVKIRGFRIELGEIEAALAALPEVREVVVLAREDTPGDPLTGAGKRLVAYLVPQAGCTLPETAALRSRLAQSLPEYMIPAHFMSLEQLPLTPNGKVNRKALPAPDMTRSETGYVAPRTATEEILAGIWAGVLGLNKVGVLDNFFELGGHSLLSLRIIAQARQAGVQLSPRQFFQYQTIAELAAHAEEQVFPIEQGIITGEIPLTPGQARFFQKAIPDPHWWNGSIIFKVNRTRVDSGLMEQAAWHVLLHHDALRARFVCDESGWRQIIAAPEETANPFSYIDLSAVPKDERERVADSTKNEVQQSLNLSEGPLIRVVMLDLGTMRNQLLIVAHHLVIDGVSFEIIIEDMFTAYQQLADGKQVQLPPKTTSLKTWAERIYQYAQSPEFEGQLDKWLALPWAQTAPLPVDYPDGRAMKTKGSIGILWASLSVDETAILLKDVPKVYGAQVADALIMALVESIAGWTGRPWVTITMIKSGRTERIPGTEHMDLTRTVGWLALEEILLLEHRKANHPGEALESIKEQLQGLRDNSLLIDVARLSKHYGKKARFPDHLKDVSFNYGGKNAQPVIEVNGIQSVPLLFNGNVQSDACPVDEVLGFLGTISGNRLVWYWHYGKTVYEQATAEKIAAGFAASLRTLIAHCQSASKENFAQDIVK